MRKRSAAKKPPTRSERRSSREAHRTRLILLGATVLSAVILTAWFPASALYHQRSSLSAANAQLARLRQEDAALRQERKNLSSSAEVDRLAREQYQLVSPGQQAYEILPRSRAASSNAAYASDPGTNSPVPPSASSVLPPGGVTQSAQNKSVTEKADAASDKTGSGASQSENLIQRMLRSLEFWR